MNNISLSRRRLLLGAAPLAALGAAQAIGLAGCAKDDAATDREIYAPVFFTAPEWNFIHAAVDRLIPSDEVGPSAVAAGVPEFIDRQMEAPYGHGAYFYMHGPFLTDLSPTLGYQLRYTPRELYRSGIASVDAACRQANGKVFAELTAADQDAFLTALEHNTVTLSGPPAAAFFAQLLENTREGYFADPMYGGNRDMGAWKMIGFPGARADFTDWIDQAGKVYPFGPVAIDGTRR